MGVKEYEEGIRLEIIALDKQRETGANAFFSLIHAAFRQADSTNSTILARIFPKTRQELVMLQDSAKYETSSANLVAIAKLLATARTMMGVGIHLYEISTEIAGATGESVDKVHVILSQHYREIVSHAE